LPTDNIFIEDIPLTTMISTYYPDNFLLGKLHSTHFLGYNYGWLYKFIHKVRAIITSTLRK